MGVLQFFGKLDFRDPGTWLGILGALGAPAVIWKIIHLAGRALYPLWIRISERGLISDFYYKRREIGYRISSDEQNYVFVRNETITACEELSALPLRYRWTAEGDFDERVTPTTYSLRDAQRERGEIGRRKQVVLNPPLRKGKTTNVVLTVKCTRHTGSPEKMLSISSPRRVDELVLRVIFPLESIPSNVHYRVLDADGEEIKKERIEDYDILTGEFKKRIIRPKRLVAHRIEWD